jgi:hypothetical protein
LTHCVDGMKIGISMKNEGGTCKVEAVLEPIPYLATADPSMMP